MALVDLADGTVSARYEYGPFGEVIRATGPMARANPFRFSTKYQDDETDLLYYGYRYYKSSIGRWISRDPIMEEGGNNLYGFILNEPVASVDRDGREVGYTYNPDGSMSSPFDGEITLDYEFRDWAEFLTKTGIWDYRNQPNGFGFVHTMDDVLAKINKTISHYDPKGKCGRCIKRLTISNHGAGGGVLPFGNGQFRAFDKKWIHWNLKDIPSEKMRTHVAAKAEEYRRTEAFLKAIRDKMCEGGTIYFVICGAGGPLGGDVDSDLIEQLQDIFGPKATAVVYQGDAGYFWGDPVPTHGGKEFKTH